MRIPEVVILRNGNQRNRLTVAPGRITLKLKQEVTEEEVKHLSLFATMVAQRTLPIFLRTMRGCFSKDMQSIEMANTSRSLYCLYCFDELEPEGMSTDPVTSSDIERESTVGGGYWQGGRSGAQMWNQDDWMMYD